MDQYQQQLKFASLTKIWPNLKHENLRYCLDKAPKEGLVLEFGVSYGTSIRFIAETVPHRTVYGFDTFTGLPEDWMGFKVGAFSNDNKMPDVPQNVRLIKGLFQDTLPKFPKSEVAFVHIDCDLYSSTSFVLDQLADYMVRGTVLVFDEFYKLDYHDDKQEFDAFLEFVESHHKDYRVISLVPTCNQKFGVMLL